MTADLPWLAREPATPEAITELRARLAQLLGEYDQVRRNLDQLRSRLRQAEGKARTQDGGIELTVGPGGDLRGLRIDPRAYRKLSPTQLADEIVRLCHEAVSDVRRQLEQEMTPFLPAGVTYQQVASGDVDPASWAPRQPLTAGTFEEWWAQFRSPSGGGPNGRAANGGRG